MHFVISYDLKAEGTKKAELEEKLEAVLAPYQHVKRLTAFYVVGVNNEQEWERLRLAINEFANHIKEEFYYVMTSPNPNPAKYNGMLYRGEWDAINEITMKETRT